MFTDCEIAGMADAVTASLPDTGTITRPGAALPAFNVTTGVLTPSAGTVVYTGPCRVSPAAGTTEAVFGEENVTRSQFVVVFPAAAVGARLHDIITVTKSDDADVLGLKFRILRAAASTFPISKAFACEVVEQ